MLREYPAGGTAPDFKTQALVPHLDNVWSKDSNGKKAYNDKAIDKGHGQESILKRADDRKGAPAVVCHGDGISSVFYFEYLIFKGNFAMKTIGRTSDFCLMLINQVLVLAHTLVLDCKLAGRKYLFLKWKRWVVMTYLIKCNMIHSDLLFRLM